MNTFKDKVIVITGSTQGIGKRTAEILAQKGAKIVINSRNKDIVKSCTDEFNSNGYHAFGSAGDISDFNYCLKLRDEVINHYGRIDFLINNAGVAVTGTMDATQYEIFEKVTKINLFGSIYPTKAFMDDLCKTKGGALFISSLAGVIGLPGYTAYSSSKRAIVSMAESLQNELYGNGMFVGVNYPGFTENDVNKKMIQANGTEITLKKRENVKVDSLDKTVNSIIKQLKNRKFRSFSSTNGRIIYYLYRLSPQFSMFVLRINRKKIMQMD